MYCDDASGSQDETPICCIHESEWERESVAGLHVGVFRVERLLTIRIERTFYFGGQAFAQEIAISQKVGLCHGFARILQHSVPMIASYAAERGSNADASDQFVWTNSAIKKEQDMKSILVSSDLSDAKICVMVSNYLS